MKENNFTDKAHWDSYWKQYQYDKIPAKVVFEPFVSRLSRGKSFIEIGGFPGVHAAYFYRQGIKDVTILDFHIDAVIVREFEKRNGLPEGCIRCIDSDFFAFTPDRAYDVVFSSGFIEHFEDTEDAIRRHVRLLTEKGQLLILIPNFLGINGMIQRKYDKPNLDAHNLKSMEVERLKKIMEQFELRDVSIDFLGKPMVWLEPKPENEGKRKGVKLLSYALKLVPIKSNLLSPYIAIYARR